MLDQNLTRALRDAVDAGFGDQTAFTADIVRSPPSAARSSRRRT